MWAGAGRLLFLRHALRPWRLVRASSLEAMECGAAGAERAALLSTSRSASPARSPSPAPAARSGSADLAGGHPDTNTRPSVAERTRAFFKTYGKLGLGVYMAISTVSLAGAYTAVRLGVDVPGALERLGVRRGHAWDAAGTFAVAYGVHKLFLPLRLLLTASVTRAIHRRLHPRV